MVTLYETYLQEAGGIITMQDSAGQTFTCPATEFLTYEPDYPALASPAIVRRWTMDAQCVSDGASQTGDPDFTFPRFREILRKIAQYQACYDAAHPVIVIPPTPPDPPMPPEYPTIYVILTLSGGDGEAIPGIYPNDNALKTLTITGTILSNPDDPASVLSISGQWRIPVFRVAREKFAHDRDDWTPQILDSYPLKVTIAAGVISMTHTRKVEGVYMIDDDGFELVDGSKFGAPGQYKVSLIGEPKYFKVIAS